MNQIHFAGLLAPLALARSARQFGTMSKPNTKLNWFDLYEYNWLVSNFCYIDYPPINWMEFFGGNKFMRSK